MFCALGKKDGSTECGIRYTSRPLLRLLIRLLYRRYRQEISIATSREADSQTTSSINISRMDQFQAAMRIKKYFAFLVPIHISGESMLYIDTKKRTQPFLIRLAKTSKVPSPLSEEIRILHPSIPSLKESCISLMRHDPLTERCTGSSTGSTPCRPSHQRKQSRQCSPSHRTAGTWRP
jgi:hypothetical protein